MEPLTVAVGHGRRPPCPVEGIKGMLQDVEA